MRGRDGSEFRTARRGSPLPRADCLIGVCIGVMLWGSGLWREDANSARSLEPGPQRPLVAPGGGGTGGPFRENERCQKNTTPSRSFVVTAYCPCEKCCGRWADGYTSTGLKLTPESKVVAVDPKEIPLGTTLFIPGYGKAVAADIGGAIKGNRLDVFFWTHEEALRWGRQALEVRVE